MKKTYFSLFAILFFSFNGIAQTPCSGGTAGGYPCNGITLQSFIQSSTMGAGEAQDSWGWTDPLDNKEYAIVALDNGTAFVDITNPTSPVYLGRLNTHTSSSLWRDVKVFNNHAYIVSDSNGNHGMQIFDLTRLRSVSSPPVSFTEDGWETWGTSSSNRGRAHNIIINEDTGYAYVMGVSPYISGGIVIFNLNSSLTNPPIVATYSAGGYTHDAQVIVYDGPDPDHQGKEILIGSFSGSDYVRILDVTNKSSITQIGVIDYTDKAYTHQGWFTEDKRFFITGDELDETNEGFNTRTLVFDLEDLDNPSLYYTHYGTTAAIDHNGYVRGNRFYLANYAAGMRIFNIDGLYNESSPSMTEVNYFDTFPASNGAGFDATWNVYPYFESGNLVVTGFGDEFTSGDGGLFILRDPNFDATTPTVICQNITATLDRLTGSVTISANDVDGGSTDNIGITELTITGQTTFTCADVGNTFNVILMARDGYGNSDSCVAQVTIAAETTTHLGGGSWSNGTPDIGSNAKISTDYNTFSFGSIDACTCEVDASRTLTINAGDYLSTTEDITVNGNLIVAHEGAVVQENDNAVVTNNGTIDVQLTTPNLASRDFMILGSPMSGETRNNVWNSAFLVLDHHTSNFVPNPAVATAFPLAENFADDNYDNWIAYTGNINVGEGYIVRPQSGYGQPGGIFNYNYTGGALNNGTVNFPIIYNGSRNASPNILSNPYASAIWAGDFINANPMIDEVYFWEHNTPPSNALPGAGAMNFSMEDISMFNLSGGVAAASGGTAPNGYISTGQGFGVKATSAGIAVFNNSMRRTDNNNTLRVPDMNRMWVKVEEPIYTISSSMLLAFRNDASSELENGMDSKRMATVISLFSHLQDGSQELGIQSMEAFRPEMKIPIGFSSQVTEELDYTISLDGIEGQALESSTIYLVDNLLGIITDLSNENYTFKSNKGTFNSRFTIFFENDEVLGPHENADTFVHIFPNPATEYLNIFSPKAFLTDLEVYDLMGRRISQPIEGETHTYVLPLTSLKTGVYFVKIMTQKGSVTKKLLKH